jgi:hypothetical protein
MVGHDDGFGHLRFAGAQRLVYSRETSLIFDRLQDVSSLFLQAFRVIIDVTSLFSNAWSKNGGGGGVNRPLVRTGHIPDRLNRGHS